MFVSVRPMPIPEDRAMLPGQDPLTSRKMILPAIPTDTSVIRESMHPAQRLSVPVLQTPPLVKSPQALEAEIVRLGNERKAAESAPLTANIAPGNQQKEKILPSGYRPQHMVYQVSAHSVIDGLDFPKKGGFSLYFSWHDILLFCLVGLVAAVTICSALLIFVK